MSVSSFLLEWYRKNARQLPWRAPFGETQNPYIVWLSEIMLQQTTVPTVIPYFLDFMKRWPDIAALAAAPRDELLAAWAGLGYYARARNLHLCAQTLMDEHNGIFPNDEKALLALPGIGPYTAAALQAIAFQKKATVVDGNIERIVTRLFALKTPLPKVKPVIRKKTGSLVPEEQAGDFAQAMMDLGSSVCTPTSPNCPACPIADFCRAKEENIAESLPKREKKKKKPVRYGIAFALFNDKGDIWLRTRPDKGLLGGMKEIPSTSWGDSYPSLTEAGGEMAALPIEKTAFISAPPVKHIFTHFELNLKVAAAQNVPANGMGEGFWAPFSSETEKSLPSVMRKIMKSCEKNAMKHPIKGNREKAQ